MRSSLERNPLKVGDGKVLEIECIEYRGGKGKVRYVVDARRDPMIVIRQ